MDLHQQILIKLGWPTIYVNGISTFIKWNFLKLLRRQKCEFPVKFIKMANVPMAEISGEVEAARFHYELGEDLH